MQLFNLIGDIKMAGLEGQIIANAHQLGVIGISNEVNHLYGNTATNITNDDSKGVLVLIVESGTFRYQLGDTTGTISASDPGASVTDGSGSFKIPDTGPIALSAPSSFTVIGTGATDILTYYWL